MDKTAPASELERRKQVKVRLRSDLEIEPQRYEGRIYFVVKDPVSLRYYRLKEHERFLLRYMDGRQTLDDAQKAYELEYRPDRLKLEDLEAFAQQLITAGLAQNESPRAGKLLYERRGKRRRSEILQAVTNILYIKIPVFDPDRLLVKMLRPLGWIFSLWFFALSVAVMAGAALLVATHFETFRSKLPNYHEFFSFRTVVYLWAALGVVKVIHEFGHGLSCKKFGGEVHEMGALFLCLSPALYCNVSDAWTLPNKWHRIIISAAGIYVELIIAAIATFVWWNTPTHPFVNNLSLSLMIVCSVSTVVFNANPLMRYDGYYVLADWLEIPNLRERSNRFLTNTFLEHCLGVEVLPEPYMALGRKVLFVSYAILSYVYRWVVTFSILYFLSGFLKPYKLEVVSRMLTAAAAASMVGWPLYRLGKNIHRRGRLPDMKRWRVAMTAGVAAALVAFVCLVPVPVSRVRGVGLVQPKPEATAKVFVRHPGILERLRVREGQEVQKGDVLAEFSNLDLRRDLDAAQADADAAQGQIEALGRQRREATDQADKAKITQEAEKVRSDKAKALAKVDSLKRVQREELVLRAPETGVVGTAPHADDVGRYYEKDPSTPFCTINQPRQLRVCLPVVTPEFNRLKENLERLSPAAAKAHRRLRAKVSVAYENLPLAAVLTDLAGKAGGPVMAYAPDYRPPDDLPPVTFSANKAPLAAVLDKILGPLGLGYVVVSDEGADNDGTILIRKGRERGYPEGPRPMADLPVTIRVQGRGGETWQGKLTRLPESEAKEVPLALSSRAGGPVAVKAGGAPGRQNALVPQAQQFLVYIDIVDPDGAIVPGSMAQVKVHCRPETCLSWLWRTLNNTFDLGLL
jgi:putative peptide zinc metalloprotease protein